MILQTGMQKSHFCVRPWSLLTISNFSERGPTDTRYFNVSTLFSRRDNKKDAKLCSYCRLQDETTNHIFAECKFAIKLWSDLRHYCQCSFDLSILDLQRATFGFFEIAPDLVTLLNHMLLLYKYNIYSSRDSSKLSFAALLKDNKKAFDLEKEYRQEMKGKLKLSLKYGVRLCN